MSSDVLQRPVALVGGRGFIGRALSEALGNTGWPYWVVDHRMNPATDPDVEYRNLSEGIAAALAGADTMIYMASVTTPYLSEVEPELEVKNIDNAMKYFDAAIEAGVRRIVFLSSGGTVYGESATALAETAVTEPSCFYGVGKLSIEHLLQRYANRGDVQASILRLSNVYGEHQTARGAQGLIAAAINAGITGAPLTLYGDTVRDYIHISDITNAIITALGSEATAIFNISSGLGIRSSLVVKLVSQQLGREIQVTRKSKRPCDCETIILSNDKASTILGWKPTIDLQQGIALAVQCALEKAHSG